MKRNIFLLSISVIFLFCQCKTIQLHKIERMVKSSTNTLFINQPVFDKGRRLMLNTFSKDIIKNDTIIILEYFTDPSPFYSCKIYESENKTIKKYRIVKNTRNNRIYTDSLTTSDVEDGIMPMVINNQLDEVKKRGEAPGLTPSITLIINILTKDKRKNKYNIQTIQTQKFSTHKEMPQELWEETRKAKPYIKSD